MPDEIQDPAIEAGVQTAEPADATSQPQEAPEAAAPGTVDPVAAGAEAPAVPGEADVQPETTAETAPVGGDPVLSAEPSSTEPVVETVTYPDGTEATGVAPLPDESPAVVYQGEDHGTEPSEVSVVVKKFHDTLADLIPNIEQGITTGKGELRAILAGMKQYL